MSGYALDALPHSARELVDVIGLPAALAFIVAYGNQQVLIPKGERAKGIAQLEQFAEIIGAEATSKLAHHYGGGYFSVPKCAKALRQARNQAICAKFDAITATDKSARFAVGQLAAEFDLNYTTIWEILGATAETSPVANVPVQLALAFD